MRRLAVAEELSRVRPHLEQAEVLAVLGPGRVARLAPRDREGLERHLLDDLGERSAATALHQPAVGGNAFSSAVLPASIAAFDILRFVTGLGQVKLRRTMVVFDWRDLSAKLIPLG